MAANQAELDAMLIRHELLDLLARFDDAAIRDDRDAFRLLWTEDAVWEIGPPIPMQATGIDAIVAALASFKRINLFFFRLTGRPVIEITGEEATLRSPTIELAGREGNLGYGNVALYVDRAVRVNGTWRFKSRSYQYIWVDTELPLHGEIIATRS